MVFLIFFKSFIIFEHIIYPCQKCEAGLLLLVGCLVAILREGMLVTSWAFVALGVLQLHIGGERYIMPLQRYHTICQLPIYLEPAGGS
jgi:hypothetical protein